MNEMLIFNNPEFGNVRVVEMDGEPWLVGKDVAAALGYANPRKALDDHVDPEDKQKGDGVTIRDSIGREQHPTVINESGLYSLVLSSKLPTAKKFKHWVTSEVLPAIRKTGSYSSVTPYQQMIVQTRMEDARIRKAQILERLANSYDGTYRQILQAYVTKELTGEFLLPLPSLKEKTYSAGDIGKELGISANRVGALANQHGLKTAEYGEWFKDKSPYSEKEVTSFRYYKNVIPVLRSLA